MTDNAELARGAAYRSALYWLFADLFLTCPDEDSMARLRRILVTEAGSDRSSTIATELSALAEALPAGRAEIEELAIEYTRLFGGISTSYGPAPPYESVHRQVAQAADMAAAVADFYAAAAISPDLGAVPPDHIGIEFKFLALLCREEGEAWRRGATTDAARILQQERRFLDEHLMRWAPAYLATLEANAAHPFYRHLGTSAARVLAEAADDGAFD